MSERGIVKFFNNNLEKAFEVLRYEGWFCAWGVDICGHCLVPNIPKQITSGVYKGEAQDMNLVLYTTVDDVFELPHSASRPDFNDHFYGMDRGEWADQHRMYVSSDQVPRAMFFHGKHEESLKRAITVLEECGCEVVWDGDINSRITITWNLDPNAEKLFPHYKTKRQLEETDLDAHDFSTDEMPDVPPYVSKVLPAED